MTMVSVRPLIFFLTVKKLIINSSGKLWVKWRKPGPTKISALLRIPGCTLTFRLRGENLLTSVIYTRRIEVAWKDCSIFDDRIQKSKGLGEIVQTFFRLAGQNSQRIRLSLSNSQDLCINLLRKRKSASLLKHI